MYPLCGMVSHPTTAPCLKQHDIFLLYIIWITKGKPRRAMRVLALQEIVMFTLTTIPSTCTCWGVTHQHTHVPEDNTSAHTRAGGVTHQHTHTCRRITHQHTHVPEANTSAHTHVLGDTHQHTHVLGGNRSAHTCARG